MAEAKRAVIAIVGGETLVGREVRDVLASADLPARVRLVGAGENDEATLAEQDGEPVVVSALDEENLTGADVVILAGPPASGRKAYTLLRNRSHRPEVIDLAGGLEDLAEARLRAPMIEPAGFTAMPGAIHVIAHPAAIALTMLVRRAPALRAIALILAPVSEHGKRGVDELQQQVIDLLSFKPLNTEVFDAQIAFNLLARYGADAPCKLETAQRRIEAHVAAFWREGGGRRKPSIRLIQAPLFHGFGFSIWFELARREEPAAFAAALRSPGIEVREAGEQAPDMVAIAGQSGLIAGAVESDANFEQGMWVWAVADNLRLTADNAVAAARQLLEGRPL